jgi:hypothetical protein
VKKRLAFSIVCSSLALVLAACGEDGGGAPADLPAEQIDAAGAAQTSLAAEVGIDESSIELVSVSDEVWQDSCLGLGGPAESCLAAETPGFRVVLEAEGKEYTYRTDLSGDEVRLEVTEG